MQIVLGIKIHNEKKLLTRNELIKTGVVCFIPSQATWSPPKASYDEVNLNLDQHHEHMDYIIQINIYNMGEDNPTSFEHQRRKQRCQNKEKADDDDR